MRIAVAMSLSAGNRWKYWLKPGIWMFIKMGRQILISVICSGGNLENLPSDCFDFLVK